MALKWPWYLTFWMRPWSSPWPIAHHHLEDTSPYCKPTFPPQIPSILPSKATPKKISTILTNIIHIGHVGFHVDLPSIENVMGCDPKLPFYKRRAGAHDTLDQWELKDSQEFWPNDFLVNMPSNMGQRVLRTSVFLRAKKGKRHSPISLTWMSFTSKVDPLL